MSDKTLYFIGEQLAWMGPMALAGAGICGVVILWIIGRDRMVKRRFADACEADGICPKCFECDGEHVIVDPVCDKDGVEIARQCRECDYGYIHQTGGAA